MFHSKLLYKAFHAGHHAIPHPGVGPYDSIYGYTADSIAGVTVILLPFFLLAQTHIGTVVTYIFAFSLFGLIHHHGREFIVSISLPTANNKLVLFDASFHDDHHVYRHGNYCDFLPILDRLFGTDLVIPQDQRRPLPAEELWGKVRKTVVNNSKKTTTEDATGLTEEELHHIAAVSSKLSSSSSQSSFLGKRGSALVVRTASAIRHFSNVLLEEHPECMPDPNMMTYSNVVERRKVSGSGGSRNSVALNSPEGRRLSAWKKE
jgi:hypothetical protein